MPDHLFVFIQLEFPWELGPPDGRYLMRAQEGGEPERVVVLGTLGASIRSAMRSKRRRAGSRAVARGGTVAAEPPPPAVPTSRATIIDPTPVAAERQAKAWLRDLDPELAVSAEVAVLNRVLYSHRISTANPYVHEVSPSQALTIRAGWGEGEQVADGRWLHAQELRWRSSLPAGRRRGRVAALRSQERFAELLGARSKTLLCEEFALRARLDLDEGREEHAAIELANAYRSALVELREEALPELEIRIAELDKLAASITSSEDARESDAVMHALERLEAALRARALVAGTRV
jgi:hypothetical protein